MNVLALDLGTKTGFACNIGDVFDAGTWTLATPKELKAIRPSRMDRRNDPRVHKLFAYLFSHRATVNPSVVVFEDIQFSSYTLQVQLWASLRAAVWLAFPPASGVNVECVPVATLKKFATGAGNATKQMMMARAPKGLDDNGADAFHLWNWARVHIKI